MWALEGHPSGSVQGWCGATELPLLGVGTGKGSSDTLVRLGCPSSPTRMLAGPWVPLNSWNSTAMCSSFCTFTMASPLELVEAVLVIFPWHVGRMKGDSR